MSAGTRGRRVIVVGGGPAGLGVAGALRRFGVNEVIVYEREQHAGGAPRHTDHLGFGLRDLHRLMTGPAYARRIAADAAKAGVQVHTGYPVFDVDSLDADAIVLATGVRERPRSARLVPGDRPAGVFTTGTVQQLTALHGRQVGARAVIVGAEHVSFSAILSLRHGGCRTVAMITPYPQHQTYAPLRLATATRLRVPIRLDVDVAQIIGRSRVEAVLLTDGSRIACDTVVFTGGWVGEHELARRAGVPQNAAKSPIVDLSWRTQRVGVFAAGNLVHPAETADICALGGRRVAAAVLAFLDGETWPTTVAGLQCESPVLWAAPAASGITLRTSTSGRARVVARSAQGTLVHRSRRRTLRPNRAIHIPACGAASITLE